MSLNCLACGKILDGQRRKYCSQKCIANHRPMICKNCGKKYFAHAMSRYCSSECKKENFKPSLGFLKKWAGKTPVEFKLCNKCDENKRYNLFREVRGTKHGWTDTLGKKRYSYCKDCESKRQKEDRDKFPEKRLFLLARRRAKVQNVPFNITKDYIKKIWPKDNKCPIFRTEFKSGIKNKYQLPSLDKIVPLKGYVEGNVAIISFKANQIKSDITDLEIFKKIYDFYNIK